MTDTLAPSTSDQWSTGQTLMLVGAALLVLGVITVGYIFGIEYSARRKTTAIIKDDRHRARTLHTR